MESPSFAGPRPPVAWEPCAAWLPRRPPIGSATSRRCTPASPPRAGRRSRTRVGASWGAGRYPPSAAGWSFFFPLGTQLGFHATDVRCSPDARVAFGLPRAGGGAGGGDAPVPPGVAPR